MVEKFDRLFWLDLVYQLWVQVDNLGVMSWGYLLDINEIYQEVGSEGVFLKLLESYLCKGRGWVGNCRGSVIEFNVEKLVGVFMDFV